MVSLAVSINSSCIIRGALAARIHASDSHSAGMRIAGACRRFARRIERTARERDSRMIAERNWRRGEGCSGEGKGGGKDSLPGLVLIVPGNEGVIK